MPADTATKRFSAMHMGSPWRGILPLPDGTVAQGDRQTVMFLYAGILAGVLEEPEPVWIFAARTRPFVFAARTRPFVFAATTRGSP